MSLSRIFSLLKSHVRRLSADKRFMTDGKTTHSTLLAALWLNGGNENETREALTTGALKLTGNFKGREQDVARETGK